MCSRPDIVRSESQRRLLAYWSAARGAAPLPTWSVLQLDALAVPPDNLSFLDVVATNGNARFQIKFHGAGIAELYGSMSCVGKFLDEILPSSSSHATLATYRHVVAHRLPVYTISDMRDPSGRIVHYERLLLPFEDGRPGVGRILASLETVSPEGVFETHGLMTATGRSPAFALCTAIVE
jgi:hypothetical protein